MANTKICSILALNIYKILITIKNLQSTMKFGAAIIAGGKSTRFEGQNKALISVLGETILNRNIQTLQTLFEEIHIVSNNASDFLYTGIPVFSDVFKEIGPLGGIYTALMYSNCEAVFIFSCDMPFLSAELIKEIMLDFTKKDTQILIPQILNKIEPLHAIYSSTVLQTLKEYLINTEEYKIRLFFPKVHTSYLALENSKENQKAFLNMNAATDIKSIEDFM
ncbi:MAG: molybdenum cofactor guanylyltransferase [Bacteroidales bacterium]